MSIKDFIYLLWEAEDGFRGGLEEYEKLLTPIVKEYRKQLSRGEQEKRK